MKIKDYMIEEKNITEPAIYAVEKLNFEKATIKESDWIEPQNTESKVKKYKLATFTLKELYEASIKGDDWNIGRLKKFPNGIKITFMLHVLYKNNSKTCQSEIWKDMIKILKGIDEDECILLKGRYNPEDNELRVGEVQSIY